MKKLAPITWLMCISAATIHAASAAQPRKQTQYAAGIYGVSYFVVSAVASDGSACPGVTPNTYASGFFTYPGPSKPGAINQTFINLSGAALIQTATYPITPASGVATWSGNYSFALLPGGSSVSGTFSSTTGFVNTTSFVNTASYTYPLNDTLTCTTVIQGVYIRTGK